MFFPIGDDNRDRRLTPIVNYAFIVLNILVFIFLQDWGRNTADAIAFTYGYATVPAEILSGKDIYTETMIQVDQFGRQAVVPGLYPSPQPVHLTLLTSTFMHGSIGHLAGNMLFLFIFGDNLENVMGHRNYFFFYLLCGILAALAHVYSTYFLGQSLFIPSLGASGAISGVMGGYILMFPTRRVHVWLFLFFTVSVPAFIAVGLWFVFQVVNGLGMLSSSNEAGGVAYAAHIGGFIVGLILVKFFVQRKRLIEKAEAGWERPK